MSSGGFEKERQNKSSFIFKANSDIIQREDVLVSQNFPLISKKLSILHLGGERNLYLRGNLRHIEPLQTKQISDDLIPFLNFFFF